MRVGVETDVGGRGVGKAEAAGNKNDGRVFTEGYMAGTSLVQRTARCAPPPPPTHGPTHPPAHTHQLTRCHCCCCRYHRSRQEAQASLPFDCGFEAVGLVAGVGPGVEGALRCPFSLSRNQYALGAT